jgi:hypothetical protein
VGRQRPGTLQRLLRRICPHCRLLGLLDGGHSPHCTTQRVSYRAAPARNAATM